MKEIQLTKGFVALVDDEDYEALAAFKWCASWTGRKWYAVRRLPRLVPYQIGKKVYMHKVILGVDGHDQIDHRNGNGLDNRRENIRRATSSQNGMNKGKAPSNTSGFKGVSQKRGRNKWVAQIKKDQMVTYLGIFDTPEEAAKAYDRAAAEVHGEFAKLNYGADS